MPFHVFYFIHLYIILAVSLTHIHKHRRMHSDKCALGKKSNTGTMTPLWSPGKLLWSLGDLLCSGARSHPAWPQSCTARPSTPRLVSKHLREKVSPAPTPGSFQQRLAGSLGRWESYLRVSRGGPAAHHRYIMALSPTWILAPPG